ncbi:MAG: ankyrin repeat domain-containing protein [Planctomycetaceae bacterium]|jgi:ankyrin repeat protein|nr:ankyrin repeat domain-containing protein [Planctomycetaceae bacterium]
MANFFYYDTNGVKQGLINSAQLKVLAENGTITPETKIENEEGQQTRADKVRGLSFGSQNANNVPSSVSTPPVIPAPSTQVPPPSAEKFRELCEHGTLSEVETAIRRGANINAKDEDDRTMLFYAAKKNPNPEVIAALVKAGANVNAKDKYGGTALFHAAWNPNPEMITALVRAGADVNVKDKDGGTLLFHAVLNPNPEVITALIRAGADVNAKLPNGMTALCAAAFGNPNPEMISKLVRVGVDVNAKAHDGKTALFYAALNNSNPEVITRLVKEGVEVVNIRNLNDTKELFYAVRMNTNTNHSDIFQVLQQAITAAVGDETLGTMVFLAASSANPSMITAVEQRLQAR